MGLLVKDKDIVVPGEDLAMGMDYLPSYGTFREGDRIVAAKLGLSSVDGRVIRIIPLSGKYLPKRDDTIIGRVVDVTFSGWRIDINSAYSAMLSLKDATSDFIARGSDLTRYFNFGDQIVTKIINVTSQNLVDLTMKGLGLRKLGEGRILTVNPYKVPRIIGKQGSMVGMVKDATNCRIIVGQNGIVWVQGEPENELRAVAAIRKIESESHISGLTDRIKTFLEKDGQKR
ncbi:RNA-binding protein [Candidatus Woesearchaeota archaeon]|nr:RNA-binding protein [Candidatus Woesearchaeota archaeon]